VRRKERWNRAVERGRYGAQQIGFRDPQPAVGHDGLHASPQQRGLG